MTTYYYDYEKIPINIADEAFQDFYQNPDRLSILDLLADVIRHCDAWCATNSAFSEQDNRDVVIRNMQAYLQDKYQYELMDMLEQEIIKNKEKIDLMFEANQRRN